MLRLLVLSTVLALSLADGEASKPANEDALAVETKAELKPEASYIRERNPYDDGHRHEDRDDWRDRDYSTRDEGSYYGRDPAHSKKSRIVEWTKSPIFFEPTYILDYRFLKSGGRDYAYSEDGQVLILPRGIKSDEPNKKYKDYDSLIDSLKEKYKQEQSRHDDNSFYRRRH